jgi:hypothetical protein
MAFGTKNKKIYEHFTVIDESNTLVSGISPTAFTSDLFEPSGQEVSNQIDVDTIELGSGHYRTEFIPNEIGTWYLTVYHDTYFPWGKSDSIQIYQSDFDEITELVKQNRNYNVSVEDVVRKNVTQNASQAARNVPMDKTDYIITRIKGDNDATWSETTVSGISYAWYKSITDTLPYKMGDEY